MQLLFIYARLPGILSIYMLAHMTQQTGSIPLIIVNKHLHCVRVQTMIWLPTIMWLLVPPSFQYLCLGGSNTQVHVLELCFKNSSSNPTCLFTPLCDRHPCVTFWSPHNNKHMVPPSSCLHPYTHVFTDWCVKGCYPSDHTPMSTPLLK